MPRDRGLVCKIEGCTEPATQNRRLCITHIREYKAAAVQRMRERSPDRFKHYTLKRDYGISLDDYNVLLFMQGDKCAVCGASDGSERGNNNGSKRLSVDHNHSTGDIRGLLCGACNKGIGSLLDSPDLLRKAADYLEASANTLDRVALIKTALSKKFA